MNRAERHEALIQLHTAKLIHARLLGENVPDTWKVPSHQNVHTLQILIDARTKK